MLSDDVAPTNNAAEMGKNDAGWRRRFKILLAACIVCVILVAAIQLYSNLTHRPQIVYPPEFSAALRAQWPNRAPVNPKIVDYYVNLYGLDTCNVDMKYGALCQDGYATFDGSEGACSEHGGVKVWVECK
jgi:hypothetical protein